jgi:hypothetical protein
MQGEMYVLQLLNLSGRARTRAESHQAVRFLPAGPDIRQRLLLAPDETAGPMFELLAEDLENLFRPPELPEFSDADFDRVYKAKASLAMVLDERADPLGVLFDPGPIHRAIAEVSNARPPASIDAESLLLLMMAPGKPAAIRRARGMSERAWAELMAREHWIWPEAEAKLQAAAVERGWPSSARPARILAGIVRGTAALALEDSGDVPPFDALAIAVIRRRVEAIVASLREEADRRVTESREAAPALRSLSVLHGWIDLYEQHAVARGLLKLCGGTTTIQAMLANADVQDRAATFRDEVSGPLEPEPDEYLSVSAGEPFPRLIGWHRKVCVTFDIECLCRGQSVHRTVLRIIGLPVDDFDILRRGLRALRGRDLSLVGDTLTERLLNTDIASCRRLDGLLRAALEDHIAVIAQTIVLSDIDKPIDAAVPWRNDLSRTLRFSATEDKAASKDKDVILPKSLEAVVEDLRIDYQGRGHELTVKFDAIRAADQD